MPQAPTPEQHCALLNDCWELARALPTSGVLDRGRKPYRARRLERKLSDLEHDPVRLFEYVRGMARRTSEGLDLLVEYNRVDLSIETLIIDRSKIYAPLFTAEDRAAAEVKLAARTGQVAEVAQARGQSLREERAAREERVGAIRAQLPEDLDELRARAVAAQHPEQALAVNAAILSKDARDTAALNRLGRAYTAIGAIKEPDRRSSKSSKSTPVIASLPAVRAISITERADHATSADLGNPTSGGEDCSGLRIAGHGPRGCRGD